MDRPLSVTLTAILRLALVITVVSAAVVLTGGTVVWQLEGDRPGTTFRSWGDGIWWALTTMTTVGYGDHVPETTSGRVVAAVIMIAGVAVLGAVAAVVALIFASAVASREERILEAEATTLEARLEARLDALDVRLARIEEHLQRRQVTPDDDTHAQLAAAASERDQDREVTQPLDAARARTNHGVLQGGGESS